MNSRLLSELRKHYKSYFESKLATSLLARPEFFPTIHKVSRAILNMLVTYRSVVVNLLEKSPAIKKDLFSEEFFGHLPNEIAKRSADDQLNELIRLLGDEKSPLHFVMQFHSIFMYRIHPEIIKRMEPEEAKKVLMRKADIKKSVEFEVKFGGSARGREDGPALPPKSTDRLGIIANPVLNSLFKSECEEEKYPFDFMGHDPALNRFKPAKESSFILNVEGKDVPFVAGASGHSASYMQCRAICDLSSAELQEYALGCFAFLASGGNHGFHEVMSVVAKEIGIDYEVNNYLSCIPAKIQQADFFQKLQIKFSQFLSDDTNKMDLAFIMMDMASDMRTTREPALLRLNKNVTASYMVGMAADMMEPARTVDEANMAPGMMGMAVDLRSGDMNPDKRTEVVSNLMGMAVSLRTNVFSESKKSGEEMHATISNIMTGMMGNNVELSLTSSKVGIKARLFSNALPAANGDESKKTKLTALKRCC